MAAGGHEETNKRIGDLLQEAGLVTEEQIMEALAQQGETRKRLGELLIEMNYISEEDFAKTLADQLYLPFIELGGRHIERQATELFPKRFALKHLCVPVERHEDSLLVAMADPLNLIALDDLEWSTRCQIRVAVGVHSEILDAIERGYPSSISLDDVHQLEEEAERAIAGIAAAPAKSCIYTVVSNKGGVGKTHFAINLAMCLAQAGKRVLLVDADLGNADVQIKVGVFPKLNLLDFLDKKCEFEDAIIETDFGFHFIGGVSGEFKLANLMYAQKVKFLTAFRTMAKEFDAVVLDLSAGITRTVLDFALAGDDLLVITTPQDIVAGYACLKAAFFRLKELEMRLFRRAEDYVMHTEMSAKVIFNRVSSKQQGIAEFRKMNRAIDQYVTQSGEQFHLDAHYLGSIPYDARQFIEAERLRRPIVAVTPEGPVAQCFRDIATTLVTSTTAKLEVEDSARRARRFANFLLDSE